MSVGLAMTVHDPDGRLRGRVAALLETLCTHFSCSAVQTTISTDPEVLELFRSKCERVETAEPGDIGHARVAALRSGLELGSERMLVADCDRLLHLAEGFPEELLDIVSRISEADLIVFGRTQRAFRTHPQVQRDTESMVNRVFQLVTGQQWDVTVGMRGFSRRCAEAALAEHPDVEGVGTDTAWPLFVLRSGRFTARYMELDGLEFETADRFEEEVAAAGGLDGWVERIDGDPHRWLSRLELARQEIVAMLPFVDGEPG